MEIGSSRGVSPLISSKRPHDVDGERLPVDEVANNIDTKNYSPYLEKFKAAFDNTQDIFGIYLTSPSPGASHALRNALDREKTALMLLDHNARNLGSDIDWLAVLDPSNEKMESILGLLEKIRDMQQGAFDFQAMIASPEVSTPGKDGKTHINFEVLREKLQKLIDRYDPNGPGPVEYLYESKKEGAAGKEDAQYMADQLKLPPGSVVQNADGKWCVLMDIRPLNKMMDELDKTANGQSADGLSNVQLNGFMTNIDSQMKAVETMVKKATEMGSYSRQDRDEIGRQISSLIARDVENSSTVSKNMG